MRCALGSQGNELQIIQITLSGGHSLIHMQLAILGMQAIDPGRQLIEHLCQVVDLQQVNAYQSKQQTI